MCPAIILAINRIIKAPLLINKLTTSMQKKKGIKGMGKPEGTIAFQKPLTPTRKNVPTVNKIKMMNANGPVTFTLAVAVANIGIRPRILRIRIKKKIVQSIGVKRIPSFGPKEGIATSSLTNMIKTSKQLVIPVGTRSCLR